jgi:hypothetical protein
MWPWLVVPACLLGACTSESSPSELTSATATIENSLTVDGCSYPVTVDGVDYAPDAQSLANIRARNLPYHETQIFIQYRLTGRTGRVECGNDAGFVELPEISFVFDDASGSPRRALATVEDGLPADGCTYVVTVDHVDYTPDAYTKAALDASNVSFGPGLKATLEIEYRLTGKIGRAECGFKTYRDLPEISFTFNAVFPVEPGSGTGG